MTEPISMLAALRALLIEHAGGYIRNVVWDDRTCGYCSGIPNSPTYERCYLCEGYAQRTDISDRRGYLGYALAGGQSGAMMYRYKDEEPPPAIRRAITLLTAYGISRHLRCAAHAEHGPVTAWALVPSLQGRSPHPLEALVAPVIAKADLPRVALTVASGATKERAVRPENFHAEPDQAAGSHVLLIDDTWASGGNVESAAAALKLAEAKCVTTLVIARWLDRTRGETAEFVKQILPVDYDPDVCPFTGAICTSDG